MNKGGLTLKKYLTKVNYANLQNNSLRCGIPKEIVQHLNIEPGDSVKWIIDETGKVIVEKLEL